MGFIQYLKDTRGELRHVAWPTRVQTFVFTALVIFLSVAVALYLGVFDFFFTNGLERTLDALGVVPAQTIDTATTTPEFIATSTPVTIE